MNEEQTDNKVVAVGIAVTLSKGKTNSGDDVATLAIEDSSGPYTNLYAFEAFRDKVSLFDGINQGDRLKVTGFVRSREYGGRFYSSISAVKVENVSAPMPQQQAEDF